MTTGLTAKAPLTYTAQEVADLWGVSAWTVYQAAHQGTCPVEPIKISRRLVWPKAKVDAQLGVDP